MADQILPLLDLLNKLQCGIVDRFTGSKVGFVHANYFIFFPPIGSGTNASSMEGQIYFLRIYLMKGLIFDIPLSSMIVWNTSSYFMSCRIEIPLTFCIYIYISSSLLDDGTLTRIFFLW